MFFNRKKKTTPEPIPKILYVEPEGTIQPTVAPKPKPKPLDFERGEFLVLGTEVRELFSPRVFKREDDNLITVFAIGESKRHLFVHTSARGASVLDLNPETTNAPRYNHETGLPTFPEGYSASCKVVSSKAAWAYGKCALADVVDVTLKYDPPMITQNMADLDDEVQTLYTWHDITRTTGEPMHRTTMSRERLYMHLLAAANMAWNHSMTVTERTTKSELFGTFK